MSLVPFELLTVHVYNDVSQLVVVDDILGVYCYCRFRYYCNGCQCNCCYCNVAILSIMAVDCSSICRMLPNNVCN